MPRENIMILLAFFLNWIAVPIGVVKLQKQRELSVFFIDLKYMDMNNYINLFDNDDYKLGQYNTMFLTEWHVVLSVNLAEMR